MEFEHGLLSLGCLHVCTSVWCHWRRLFGDFDGFCSGLRDLPPGAHWAGVCNDGRSLASGRFVPASLRNDRVCDRVAANPRRARRASMPCSPTLGRPADVGRPLPLPSNPNTIGQLLFTSVSTEFEGVVWGVNSTGCGARPDRCACVPPHGLARILPCSSIGLPWNHISGGS